MLRHWILAARPKTLMAGISPVLIGSALAARQHEFYLPAAASALCGALTIQIGTNYCNDLFDHRQGADTDQRQGPTRAVQAGWVSPRAMFVATALMFGIAVLISVYLALRAGWPLVLVGALSVLCGIWYTASRFSLAYLGLGDLFVLVFFGPVAVAGTHYVQALTLESDAIVAGFAPGLLSVAILVVNNLRDLHQDARAEKRTLAVRFGPSLARWQYTSCIILAGCVPFVLWQVYNWHVSVLWASVGVLPGFLIARELWLRTGRSLNPLLGMTGAVLLLYTLLFSTLCFVGM